MVLVLQAIEITLKLQKILSIPEKEMMITAPQVHQVWEILFKEVHHLLLNWLNLLKKFLIELIIARDLLQIKSAK